MQHTTQEEFERDGHFGPIIEAKSDDSEVRVYGSHLVPIDGFDTDDWTATLDLSEWSITAHTVGELGDAIDREFADLRTIVDQMEAAVRAWHASLPS
ncbi:hypothetical protein [Microbacterium sp. 11MF]|uniref:hypothetical protein n=1 Tax=Microbacterium sp. 11MF TaxID=1169146 RepID=UPI00037D2958|nr:hypothetical protein [Microbacterium sp. 11MF]